MWQKKVDNQYYIKRKFNMNILILIMTITMSIVISSCSKFYISDNSSKLSPGESSDTSSLSDENINSKSSYEISSITNSSSSSFFQSSINENSSAISSALTSAVSSSNTLTNSSSNGHSSTNSSSGTSSNILIKPYISKINPESGYDEGITGANLFFTFDDGPSSNNTPIVLDTLKKYNVKATFFVCGPDTVERRALIKRAYDEGHAIGIHGYSHYLRSLYKSEASFFADFNKIEQMIIQTTGKKPELYRFPGGTNNGYIARDLSKKIIAKLKLMGYEYYDWNVSSFDSNSPPVENIANTVISQCKKRIQAKTPSIILLHDSSSRNNTAKAIDIIFGNLTASNFYFAPLSHSVKPVHFVK